MTILGPLPCIRCKAPVRWVRRAVLIRDTHGSNDHEAKVHAVPSRELRELVVVGEGGDHRC